MDILKRLRILIGTNSYMDTLKQTVVTAEICYIIRIVWSFHNNVPCLILGSFEKLRKSFSLLPLIL